MRGDVESSFVSLTAFLKLFVAYEQQVAAGTHPLPPPQPPTADAAAAAASASGAATASAEQLAAQQQDLVAAGINVQLVDPAAAPGSVPAAAGAASPPVQGPQPKSKGTGKSKKPPAELTDAEAMEAARNRGADRDVPY